MDINEIKNNVIDKINKEAMDNLSYDVEVKIRRIVEIDNAISKLNEEKKNIKKDISDIEFVPQEDVEIG